MAQQGVPVSTAAAALGHDPAIYLRTYAHLYPGDLRSAADAVSLGDDSSDADRVPAPVAALTRIEEVLPTARVEPRDDGLQ
jgi:hypothetical protein